MTGSQNSSFRWGVAPLMLLGLSLCVAASGGDEDWAAAEDFAAAIDAVVAEACVGPMAGRCSDADFVRRVHLDLHGLIPTPTAVQGFLAETTPDRRRKLVDDLLANRAFARRMAYAIDAMLLERDSPPGQLRMQWRKWLREAIEADQPLDKIFAKVVAAGDGDPATTPAAAFLLARGAESNRMTRAIGRTLFGRELQCAQCHDHPLDGDILQAEYHGIRAFVGRTNLFKTGKIQQLSEGAVGEVSYQSVFTEESVQSVWPQLPEGPPLVAEPTHEPGEDYLTQPSKKSRGVPVYSRRRALAEQLPENQAFQRNLANRLWAVFFGRGLIHPLDGVSPANPPSHPELLALLTERLVSGGFQLRPFVRGIVLSEVYQRAVESPSVTAVDLAEVESQVASITAARDKAVAQLQSLERAEAAAQARMRAAAEAERTVDAALQPLLAERDEARKASDAAVKAAADATVVAERAAAVAAAMTTAVAEAKRAAGLLDDDDASLKKIVTTLNAEAKSRSEVSQAALTASTNAEQARQAALEKLVKARTDVAEVAARQSPVTLAQLSREAADARAELVHRQQQLDRLGWRLALADDLTVAATSPSSATAETTVRWQSIEDRWTENLQVARLRPLTPDQFVYSMLQATGGLGRLWNKATVAVEQQPPDSVANAPEADRPTVRRDAVEQEFLNDVEALLGPFASNFGDPLLEGFQASVSQALLMANGPQVAGELVSQEEGLVRRLIAIGDPVMIVDEACLAILSRSPHPEERDELASHLTKNRDDLPQAIRELVWAMLASNEFRFNH